MPAAELITSLLSGIVILTHALSIFGKSISWKKLRLGLMRIPRMGLGTSTAVSIVLPIAEGMVILGISTGQTWGYMLAFALHSIFILVTLNVLRKDLEIACNCFGYLSERTFSMAVVWENVFFLSALVTIFPFRTETTLSLNSLLISGIIMALYILAKLLSELPSAIMTRTR